MLTELEQDALDKIADAGNAVWAVISAGGHQGAARRDANELVPHVHALQNAIMSNSAARAHPGKYRVLGGILRPSPAQGETDE